MVFILNSRYHFLAFIFHFSIKFDWKCNVYKLWRCNKHGHGVRHLWPSTSFYLKISYWSYERICISGSLRRRKEQSTEPSLWILCLYFAHAWCLSEHLMLFAFCILLISGSTWHCKEEKEIRVKENICRLNIRKANPSWFWEQKLKISKGGQHSTTWWERLEFGSTGH